MTRVVAAFILLFAISSCGDQPYFETYQDISEEGWHKDSVLHFTVDITDTNVAYDARLLLRANNNYPYSNLYIFREVESDRGRELRDTLQYVMADRFGKWLGEGVGDLKTYEWAFWPRPVQFKHAGTYKFTVQQAMRNDNLEGITQVGLSLYKRERNGKKDE